MGVTIPTGALLGSAGISAIGNIAGSALSSHGANQANAALMAFNSQEAQKNRDFQEKMYGKQLTDQENMYKKYQSPEAIAKQLQGIGITPAAVLGQGQGFGSMPSVPSVPSGSLASVGSLENPMAAYGHALKSTTSDAVSVLNAITDKNLKDKQALKVLADKASVETQNEILQWQNMINHTIGSQKAKAELNSIIVQTATFATAGELNKAQALVAETIQKLHNKEFDIKSEELSQLQTRGLFLVKSLQNEQMLQGEQIETEKTKQEANRASASASWASAAESRTRKEGIEFENSIKKVDSENAALTAQHKLAALRAQFNRDASIAKRDRIKVEAEAEKLDKVLQMYIDHPDKAKLDATLDNFNEHFPVLGAFFKILK